MKIAHVVWSMLTGGIETMLVNIINEQVKTEDVTLYIINDIWYEPLLEQLSPLCRVMKCKRKKGSKNPLALIKLNYWLWKQNPDVVHVHSYKISDVILDRRKMVRTIHNTNNPCREYPRMKALYAISEVVWADTLKQGFDSTVIENGIHSAAFLKRESKLDRSKTLQLIQISRLLIKQKGQDILIQAIDNLVKRRNRRNLHVTFIGEGEDRVMLEKMVAESNLSAYITFVGQKSQEWLHQHLADFDCLVQPSRFEGFGLTVAEAMAAKVPVLVSNIEGPMEVIGGGRYGMSFKTENAEDLADKIEKIMIDGYDDNMTTKALEWVSAKYDISVTARKYINEYRMIASRG